MSTNSLQELLKTLDKTPFTLGWGAVLAIGRDRLNLMLEQQFTAALHSDKFLLPCSGEVGRGHLEEIILGPPMLSFETAVEGGVAARVTIPILSGTFRSATALKGRSPRGMSRNHIRMRSGHTLVMDIDLQQVLSDSDHSGYVSLDLSEGRNPVCNLSPDAGEQQQLGDYLLTHIGKHPAHRTTYLLGEIHADTYAALNPVKFAICTQAAPGASDPAAANAGDGCLMICMKLKAYDNDDVLMPESGYPYLIPDDVSGGDRMYSATLLISQTLLKHASTANIEQLRANMMPEGYAFEQVGDAHVPHDMALFGNLVATQEHVTLSPAIVELDGGGATQFTARRGDGTPMPGVNWSSECLNSAPLNGQVASDGTFSATGYPFGGRGLLMTGVTANYSVSGETEQATALALVHVEPFDVNPLVAPLSPGDAEIELVGLSDDGTEAKEWTLLEPGIGTLRGIDGMRSAAYTPPAAGGVPFLAQRVQGDAGEGLIKQSLMLLHTGVDTIEVSPGYVASAAGQGAITFEQDAGQLAKLLGKEGIANEEDLFFVWSVVGEGSIVGNGHSATYTPPPGGSGASMAVIVCQIHGPDVEVYGYAVVELMTASAREKITWNLLQHFEITAPDGDTCYGNGMQQIRVRIFIETAPVTIDDVEYYIPISKWELGTLELMHGNSRVPFINAHQDGLEYTDSRQWAASKARNRFSLYQRGRTGAPETPLPRRNEAGTYADLYLHMKDGQSEEFHAQFQAEDGRMFSSRNHGDETGYRFVELRTQQVPPMDLDDYIFERKRVWNGEGKDVEDDDFSYRLQSICFWGLSIQRDGFESAGFTTLHIEGQGSTIQWEAELLDETFFSCTGRAFWPKQLKPSTRPSGLTFDPYLESLLETQGHAQPDATYHDHPVSEGQLIISVHREDDVPFWYDGMAENDRSRWFRKALDPSMVYTLRDEHGNRHRLQIGFLDPSQPGSRNHLRLVLQ